MRRVRGVQHVLLREKKVEGLKRYMTIGNRLGRAVTSCHMAVLPFYLFAFLLLASCSMIDEDRSDC